MCCYIAWLCESNVYPIVSIEMTLAHNILIVNYVNVTFCRRGPGRKRWITLSNDYTLFAGYRQVVATSDVIGYVACTLIAFH